MSERAAIEVWLAHRGLTIDDGKPLYCLLPPATVRMWNLASPTERDAARDEIAGVLNEHIAKVLSENAQPEKV